MMYFCHIYTLTKSSAFPVVEFQGEFLGRESLWEERVEISDLDDSIQPDQVDGDLRVELGQGLPAQQSCINIRYQICMFSLEVYSTYYNGSW